MYTKGIAAHLADTLFETPLFPLEDSSACTVKLRPAEHLIDSVVANLEGVLSDSLSGEDMGQVEERGRHQGHREGKAANRSEPSRQEELCAYIGGHIPISIRFNQHLSPELVRPESQVGEKPRPIRFVQVR